MKKGIFYGVLIFSLATTMVACYEDNLSELTPASGLNANSCDTAGTMSYAGNVVPVLQANCGINNSCHSSSNTSGYDLSSYAGVLRVAMNGLMVDAITWSGSTPSMPQNGNKMSVCNITKIQKWVAAGAPNN